MTMIYHSKSRLERRLDREYEDLRIKRKFFWAKVRLYLGIGFLFTLGAFSMAASFYAIAYLLLLW